MKPGEKIKEIAEREARILAGEEGRSSIYYSRKEFDSEDTAKEAYNEAVERLFDINGWSKIHGLLTADFKLLDNRGNATSEVKEGYFIHFKLPALPKNWVRINEIYKGEYVAEIKVSPSPDPTAEEQEVTEHFFTDQASSSFRVTLKDKLLSAYEIGRDEFINNQDEQAGDRKLLNTVIAEGGWAGFQDFQWQALTDYLVGLK